MKQHITRLFISLLMVFTTQYATAAPSEVQSEANGSYIFIFNDSVGDIPGTAATLVSQYNGSLRYVFTATIKGFSADISGSDAARLAEENDDMVVRFSGNGVASFNAAGGAKKGVKFTAGQVESWGAEVITSRDATVDGIARHAWIIDTGIDDYYDGVDLNIGEGKNFVIRGNNKSVEDADPNATDDVNGHGTHIAGILAAIDNRTSEDPGTGVLGIAAGATVHPVRVLHKNLWGTTDAIIAGVDYVADRIENGGYPPDAIHVVNMSLTIEVAGQEESVIDLEEAIDILTEYGDNDVKLAVCAGNDGSYAGDYSPARMYNPNVYTVASIAEGADGLILASNSNQGIPPIDFVAPGVAIESLKPGGGTWFWSGCSMATPHVAGILLFHNPVANGSVSGYPLAGFATP